MLRATALALALGLRLATGGWWRPREMGGVSPGREYGISRHALPNEDLRSAPRLTDAGSKGNERVHV